MRLLTCLAGLALAVPSALAGEITPAPNPALNPNFDIVRASVKFAEVTKTDSSSVTTARLTQL